MIALRGMLRRLLEFRQRPASLRYAHRRLQDLYDISKLLINFESVERTLPATVALITQTLPLRSAVFNLEFHGRALSVVWGADNVPALEIEAAKARARSAYAYLTGSAAPDRINLIGNRSTANEPSASRSDDRAHFLTLPLVVDHQPIFGALQIESVDRLTESDLIFVNAIVNQVAIALDRQAVIESRQATTEAGKVAAEAQRDTLRSIDHRKDEFLATLAHELRNPLAALAAAAQLLIKAEQKPAVAALARDALHRQVDHMARLLDDLLEISRITHGRIQLRKERVGAAEAIAAAIETVRPMIAAKQHDVIVDVHEPALYVDADRVRLIQIFSNLITNAAKYTDAGGKIDVQVLREDRIIVIRVIDSGIGISAGTLPNVFTMFSQVKSALDRSEGGLGIGLALAKSLVEMHGGTISALSEGVGRGSEFVVCLPEAQDQPLTPPLPVESAILPIELPIEASTRRVLIADDNRDTADSLAALLELEGNQVRAAYDGEKALELAAAFQPSVILLDIGMPKMNGYEVAKHIREQSWGKAMTLVAITGWGQADDKRHASAAGFDYHLTKPITLEALQSVVSGIVADA
jgi:signal transduction histidine kinase/CheY-like chemotaxis protein